MKEINNSSICVIGGGAAGLMAAGTAIKYGASVTVYESTGRLGKKLGITGKGRCNVTNNCSVQQFLENVVNNPHFLYGALNAFSPADTMTLFTELGVELKTERGMRVFPISDKAIDIVKAMIKYAEDAELIYEKVNCVNVNNDGTFTVKTNSSSRIFERVIIATGGKSYPLTGSDGSGYKLAMRLGHTVTELVPSLVPLTSPSSVCAELQGLSLKNVAITVLDDSGQGVYKDFGEMMFTHFGVTGPMILSASAHLRGRDLTKLLLSIDLKPALDEKTLDARILSDFANNANKDFVNSLGALLPQKLILPFISACGIDPRKKVNSVTKSERKNIVDTFKSFTIPLDGFRPIDEAIVTSGGIAVKEISPKTMESKLVPGLFFAGEIIDVDAYTGGFNLQIAFSTGYLAGRSAAGC